jgi:hypothetical protein
VFLRLLLELVGLEGGTEIAAEIMYHLIILTEHTDNVEVFQALRLVFETHYSDCYRYG